MRLSHIGWNLAGMTVPLLVAAVTVPPLLENLGKEKFGLLALAWGLIGYAGALDLGLGRALTQMVASLRGERKLKSIPDTLFTASRITLITGLIAGGIIALFAMLGGSSLIRTVSTPEIEIQISILLLAVALPAQAMSATYKGLNEAFMNFKGVSLLRVGLGVINFAGPYTVSIFSSYLPWLVSTLVVSRLVSLLIYKKLASVSLQVDPETQQIASYSSAVAKKLFSFGGWVTLSSVIGPIMVQSDRFFIATMISVTAVSIYVIPYELVVQSLVLVGAVTSVMYPGLAKLIKEDPKNWSADFRRWVLRIAFIMFFVCVGLIIFLPWILRIWIGDEVDAKSIVVGKILCVGVYANALGSMYYSAIQSLGRSDMTAKIHMIELPLYFLTLFIFTHYWGLVGIACAWVLRMIIDAALLWLTFRRLMVYQRVCPCEK